MNDGTSVRPKERQEFVQLDGGRRPVHVTDLTGRAVHMYRPSRRTESRVDTQ